MTRRAHIAMVGVPAVSHVLPSLEIIRELVRRGHRVTYANDPVGRIGELIASTGAELVPFTTTLPTGDEEWSDDPIEGMDIFLDDAVNSLPVLRKAYEEDRPDLFLYDIGGYTARVMGIEWGIPTIQLSPTYVGWADHADTVTFVGPCLGERADQGSWPRPADAEKVVLVSLGSAYTDRPDFYRECVKAFGDLPGWRTVLQIGEYVDPSALGEVPDTVEVHRWVPQLDILRQADAFVTHAGMGGSSEGLYTGTPMIAVPQAVDQFDNADRLQELGVARRIDTEAATAEALRDALLDLAGDPEVARRLADIGGRLQRSGTPYAADLIEVVLSQR